MLRKNWSNCLEWNHEQVEEFETARHLLSDSSQMIRPFDPTLALGLIVDTAKTTGIGYILFQFNPAFPIATQLADILDTRAGPMNFSLQGAWSVVAKGAWADLAPIEAEVVGYWHATKRLHYHLRGAPIIYGFVDHKPFADLYSNKGMSDLSPRMFKLMQDLMEFPYVIKYEPGRGAIIGMVDALSRAPVEDVSTLCADPMDLIYHTLNQDQGQVSHEVCFAAVDLGSGEPCPYDPTLAPLYEAASTDPEYLEIVENVVEGHKWEAYKNKPLHIVRRWGRALFESLSVSRDRSGRPLRFRGGQQVVVPKEGIPAVLERIDSVHNGADRACLLAQRSYYWDNMKSDIKEKCEKCRTCKIMSQKPKQEALYLTDPPPFIGHTQAVDFAHVGETNSKKKFLVLVDILSGYSEVFRFLLPPTSKTIIDKLTDFWNSTGWPVVFCSDGEKNLDSAEFNDFLEANRITRRKSSAGYPQSNGAAERAVQSFKRLYGKKVLDGMPWEGAWALWRDTPQQPGQLSPARLWFGRPIHHPGWYSPQMPSNPDTLAEAQENFRKRQEGYRKRDEAGNLFKHPKITWTPRPGSRVLMEERKKPFLKKDSAVVLSVNPSDRSCRVQRDSDNRTFLLNRSKLVRDPAFTDDDVTIGGVVSSTPRGTTTPLKGVLKGDTSPDISPVRRARQQIRFQGHHTIPDLDDERVTFAGGDDGTLGDQSISELVHGDEDPSFPPLPLAEDGGAGQVPRARGSTEAVRHNIRRGPRPDYKDKRPYTKKALMAELIRIADDSDIEAAAMELTEEQRCEVSAAAGLDRRASARAILDFVEEVLGAAASGIDSWGPLYTKSCELLSSTVDVLDIMRTLRELVEADGVSSTDVCKQEKDMALTLDETRGADTTPGNGSQVSTLGARKRELEEASSIADDLLRGAEETAFLSAAAVYQESLARRQAGAGQGLQFQGFTVYGEGLRTASIPLSTTDPDELRGSHLGQGQGGLRPQEVLRSGDGFLCLPADRRSSRYLGQSTLRIQARGPGGVGRRPAGSRQRSGPGPVDFPGSHTRGYSRQQQQWS